MGSNEEDIKEGLKYEIAYLTSLIKLHKQQSTVTTAYSNEVNRINKENTSSSLSVASLKRNSSISTGTCVSKHPVNSPSKSSYYLGVSERENPDLSFAGKVNKIPVQSKQVETVQKVSNTSLLKSVPSTIGTSLTNVHTAGVQKRTLTALDSGRQQEKPSLRTVHLPEKVILSQCLRTAVIKSTSSSPIKAATGAALHDSGNLSTPNSTAKVQRLQRLSAGKPKSVCSKYRIVHVNKNSQHSMSNKKAYVSRYKLVKKSQPHSFASPLLVVRGLSFHKSRRRVNDLSEQENAKVSKHQWQSSRLTGKVHSKHEHGRRRSWVNKYSLKHGARTGDLTNSARKAPVTSNASRNRHNVRGNNPFQSTPRMHGVSRYSWVSSAVRKLKQGSSYRWRRLSAGSRSKVVNTSASSSQTVARYVIRKCLYRIHKKAMKSPVVTSRKTKRQYCIYFHRFGKCKRGDSCPHIHDPDKVAVCTRYLRGTCDVESCPFSHTVAPEKMPTCRYFLNGFCNRDECPYRHVNVSKNAKACPDFIRGHCPRGLQCSLKHMLTCPDYEATGSCKAGTRCKLLHRGRRKRAAVAGETTPSNRVKKLKPFAATTAAAVEEDEDDINAPFGLRKFPSYIALPATPNLSLSITQASTGRRDTASIDGSDNEELEVSRAELSFLD